MPPRAGAERERPTAAAGGTTRRPGCVQPADVAAVCGLVCSTATCRGVHGLVARCAGLHAPLPPWAGWGKGRLRRRRRSGLLVTRPSWPARWRVAILGMVTGESSSMDLPVTRLADGDIGRAPGRPRCHQWPAFECCPHIHGPRRVSTTPVAGRWVCGQEPASGRPTGRRGSLAAVHSESRRCFGVLLNGTCGGLGYSTSPFGESATFASG